MRTILVCFSLAALAAAQETVATFPVGTTLENITVSPSGELFVTAIESGAVFRVASSGAVLPFGRIPGAIAGLEFNSDNTLYAVNETALYAFDARGNPRLAARVAGAVELNGLALFSPDLFLAADDAAGTLWLINARTGESRAWLTDPLLAPPAQGLPIGANGVKLFRGDVWVTNTGAATLLRIPVQPDGSAGRPQIFVSGLAADDFTFGVDGTVFAATQYGTIIRVSADGTSQTKLATGTFGDAAVAFGRTSADLLGLYVVNNGGLFLDLPQGPRPASIVRLKTDTRGTLRQWFLRLCL